MCHAVHNNQTHSKNLPLPAKICHFWDHSHQYLQKNNNKHFSDKLQKKLTVKFVSSISLIRPQVKPRGASRSLHISLYSISFQLSWFPNGKFPITKDQGCLSENWNKTPRRGPIKAWLKPKKIALKMKMLAFVLLYPQVHPKRYTLMAKNSGISLWTSWVAKWVHNLLHSLARSQAFLTISHGRFPPDMMHSPVSWSLNAWADYMWNLAKVQAVMFLSVLLH